MPYIFFLVVLICRELSC